MTRRGVRECRKANINRPRLSKVQTADGRSCSHLGRHRRLSQVAWAVVVSFQNPMTTEISPVAMRRKARAILLGDRIDTSGLEQTDVLATAPLTFRAGKDGVVTVLRYGVAVLFDLSVLEEDEVIRSLQARVIGP